MEDATEPETTEKQTQELVVDAELEKKEDETPQQETCRMEVDEEKIPEAVVESTQQKEVSPDDSDDDDLRQFDVLDDLEQRNNQDDSDSEGCSNGDSEDSDIPDDEIEAMLEEGLPAKFKGKRSDKRSEMLYEEREKLVLNEIGHNHFDVLPEGWVQVNICNLCTECFFINSKIYIFL